MTPESFAVRSFNDVQAPAVAFVHGAAVVIDLGRASPEVVRRAIDFCSGLAFGRHGTLEKVADDIYLLVPRPASLPCDEHEPCRPQPCPRLSTRLRSSRGTARNPFGVTGRTHADERLPKRRDHNRERREARAGARASRHFS